MDAAEADPKSAGSGLPGHILENVPPTTFITDLHWCDPTIVTKYQSLEPLATGPEGLPSLVARLHGEPGAATGNRSAQALAVRRAS